MLTALLPTHPCRRLPKCVYVITPYHRGWGGWAFRLTSTVSSSPSFSVFSTLRLPAHKNQQRREHKLLWVISMYFKSMIHHLFFPCVLYCIAYGMPFQLFHFVIDSLWSFPRDLLAFSQHIPSKRLRHLFFFSICALCINLRSCCRRSWLGSNRL